MSTLKEECLDRYGLDRKHEFFHSDLEVARDHVSKS